MNTSDENHEPTKFDDLHDRLLDVALAELVGGNAPPDLSSRIAAATFRQTAVVAQAPRTRQDRAFWASLAVAVMLLIGVTVVLVSNVNDRSQQLAGIVNTKQIELREVQTPKPAAKQDRLGQIAQETASTPLTNGAVAGLDAAKSIMRERELPAQQAPQPNATSLSLDVSQSQAVAFPAPAATDAGAAGTSPSRIALEFYSPHPSQGSYRNLGNIQDRYGSVSGGATKGKSVSLDSPRIQIESDSKETLGVPLTSLADNDALYEAQEPVSINDSIAGEDRTKRGRLGYEWKESATTQLVDEIRELQRQGKPTEKQKKELLRRLDKSVDLSAEGVGPDSSGDKYTRIVENPFIKAEGGAAVSTLSIDVDTASYANVRQFLLQMNQLPPPDAVRIEELINYFHYDYAGPPSAPGSAGGSTSDEAPCAAHVEVTACPWAPEHRLARIGIKGREMDRNKRPQSNLVFLVDVSGSMNEPAKLPLVVYGLEQLTRELGENDHIAIVVYAGTEGLVLPSTSGSKQDTILAALAKLQAGGSTAGGAGIQLAYQIAEDNFIKGGTNRVILCTDGDFNVGVTNTADLQRLVEQKAKDTGVFISTLGFGRGNLNDAMMVAISDHGNGNYHYIDNRTEARRVLVEEMTGTLVTIAKDVKIQVEFNPSQVAGYRLIGYEKRALRTEDFNNDKKDAGEIGAGHTVTALYEIVPAGKQTDVAPVDPLKYQQPSTEVAGSNDKPSKSANLSNELLTLKMRYKAPDGDTSKKLEWPITDDGKSFSAASGDLKFAASVAGFGLMLRNSQYKGNLTYAATLELAQSGIGEDNHGYRKEFVEMVRKAKELRHE